MSRIVSNNNLTVKISEKDVILQCEKLLGFARESTKKHGNSKLETVVCQSITTSFTCTCTTMSVA